MKIMGKERLVKSTCSVIIEGNRRERPQSRWRDEVEELLIERGWIEREGIVLVRDREV